VCGLWRCISAHLYPLLFSVFTEVALRHTVPPTPHPRAGYLVPPDSSGSSLTSRGTPPREPVAVPPTDVTDGGTRNFKKSQVKGPGNRSPPVGPRGKLRYGIWGRSSPQAEAKYCITVQIHFNVFPHNFTEFTGEGADLLAVNWVQSAWHKQT